MMERTVERFAISDGVFRLAYVSYSLCEVILVASIKFPGLLALCITRKDIIGWNQSRENV
jgi:hypothetical protein